MSFSLTQVVLSIFLLFAISRVFLRYKGGVLSAIGFLFWVIVFGSAILVVLFPNLTTPFAEAAGIHRGADIVIYTSIVLLFYLVFRLYIYIEDIKHDITALIQKLALKDKEFKNDQKTSKN